MASRKVQVISHLLGNAEAVGARCLEKSKCEEHEGGTDVKQVEPIVVDEEVGWKGLLAAWMVRELVVVKAFFQEYGRLLVVNLPLALEVALTGKDSDLFLSYIYVCKVRE